MEQQTRIVDLETACGKKVVEGKAGKSIIPNTKTSKITPFFPSLSVLGCKSYKLS